MPKQKQVTEALLMDQVKTYITKPESLALIQKAIDYAKTKHQGQFRKSGEPYLVHVLNVGYILATLKVGPKTICAGLLHDVVEDTEVDKEQLAKDFDEEIADLVEAVTKIGNLQFKDMKEYQAANHRKIFIAMARDVRVIVIKLVDRLHNMRTLQYMPEDKQKRIAAETLDVYAPIAHRLGMSEIKNELEDLSFLYLNPDEYHHIASLVEEKKAERDHQVNEMIEKISELLQENNLSFRIFGRSKHLYSIYRKMTTKNKSFDEILDLLAIRIVTQTELNCYEILGYIHAKYHPIPGRFKDYIAVPKTNMYQSLHTTIVGVDGKIFEIQIRTEEMDSIAEQGIAAHWRYKEGSKYDPRKEQKEIEDKLSWFKDFSAMSTEFDEGSPTAFMESLQRDVFEANVYVMTPKGRVIDLPNGSTPVDFAYRVHSDVGNTCVGATVNDILVPLNTPLKTGDVVSIKTNKNSAGPSEDWLKFVKTSQARNRIRNFVMKKESVLRAEKIKVGEQLLQDELKKRKFEPEEYMDKKRMEAIYSAFQISSYDELMYALAVKSISVINVIDRLTNTKRGPQETPLDRILNRDSGKAKKSQRSSKTGIKVTGIDTMKMAMASCCHPVYGDEIVGYVTKGAGVRVHRKDCPNIAGETKRLIDVEWDEKAAEIKYDAYLTVTSQDRNGLLNDIINNVSQFKGTLTAVSSVVNAESLTVTTKLTVQVDNYEHLKNIMTNLRKVPSVNEVERTIL